MLDLELRHLQMLEQIGNKFADATGHSISFTDRKGEWKSSLNLSRFTSFCRYVISSEKGRELCKKCNNAFEKTRDGKIDISQCHMGVSVISVPVSLGQNENDLILSYGQFLLKDTEDIFSEELSQNGKSMGLDLMKLKRLARELRILSQKELSDKIELLKLFSNYVKVVWNELQARNEYYRGYRQKMFIEDKLSSLEFDANKSKIDLEFMVEALEALLMLAYSEKAENTSDMIFSLLDLYHRDNTVKLTNKERTDFLTDFRNIKKRISRLHSTNETFVEGLFDNDKSNNKLAIRAMTIVRARYREDLTLKVVADSLYLTPTYLSRLFKKETGYNFKEYLIKTRMEKAQELLQEEGHTIKEVASSVGYKDLGYFSKSYKKYFGCSPRERS